MGANNCALVVCVGFGASSQVWLSSFPGATWWSFSFFLSDVECHLLNIKLICYLLSSLPSSQTPVLPWHVQKILLAFSFIVLACICYSVTFQMSNCGSSRKLHVKLQLQVNQWFKKDAAKEIMRTANELPDHTAFYHQCQPRRNFLALLLRLSSESWSHSVKQNERVCVL